jgi:hypothetical protein
MLSGSHCRHTRRDWLRLGGLGVLGLSLPGLLRRRSCARCRTLSARSHPFLGRHVRVWGRGSSESAQSNESLSLVNAPAPNWVSRTSQRTATRRSLCLRLSAT